MYDPSLPMNKEQVDEMAKAVIDRISVVPINKNTMKLEIKLLTGESEPMTYIRNGERYARRSGLTSKKMIDALFFQKEMFYNNNLQIVYISKTLY